MSKSREIYPSVALSLSSRSSVTHSSVLTYDNKLRLRIDSFERRPVSVGFSPKMSQNYKSLTINTLYCIYFFRLPKTSWFCLSNN